MIIAIEMGHTFIKTKKNINVLKLGSWRVRNTIYKNQKRFPLTCKINHDLTKKRYETLNYVRDLIEDQDSFVSNIVSFAYADVNCKLKFKTTGDKFHGFSTKEEFSTLVDKLHSEQMGEAFQNDEAHDELYY